MKHYSVLAVTPTTKQWIPAYLEAVGELVAKHGGKYLARTASHTRLEGNGEPVGLRIILEWPDKRSAEAFMDDPDYTHHFKARTHGSLSDHVLIAGKDDPAMILS